MASVTAAKIIRKSVFCVDNVDVKHTAEDIQSYVTSMAVSVVSCHEVKSRRRRNDTGTIKNRKAFRLCISANDRDRLLDDTKWPNSITISEWYFKQTQSGYKRAKLSDRNNTTDIADSASEGEMEHEENTVIYDRDSVASGLPVDAEGTTTASQQSTSASAD